MLSGLEGKLTAKVETNIHSYTFGGLAMGTIGYTASMPTQNMPSTTRTDAGCTH